MIIRKPKYMQLIDGKATAAQIKAEIAEEVRQIVAGAASVLIWQQYSLDTTAAVRLM